MHPSTRIRDVAWVSSIGATMQIRMPHAIRSSRPGLRGHDSGDGGADIWTAKETTGNLEGRMGSFGVGGGGGEGGGAGVKKRTLDHHGFAFEMAQNVRIVPTDKCSHLGTACE